MLLIHDRMNYFSEYPGRDSLLATYGDDTRDLPLEVNNHIHSPYSFSAFREIRESVRLAKKEGVNVLGINDFYVTDGHGEFIKECSRQGVFPLLNIEFIGVSKSHQKEGIRVNDPGNPGRIYISGKGLAHPSLLDGERKEWLAEIVRESNMQVAKMVDLLNRWLEYQGVEIALSVEEIKNKYARNLLRERHVAKAMRVEVEKMAKEKKEYGELLRKVYGGKRSEKPMGDTTGLEEELRSRLLKAGGPAFVPEDEAAFPRIEVIIKLIRDAGGIPTYPFLLDGTGGEYTEFERDPGSLHDFLNSRGIRSVEFIPPRNRPDALKSRASYFYKMGYVVTFGTEHNSSAMLPMKVSCKGGVPLDRDLLGINSSGAAFLAAHQYLVHNEGTGYESPGRKDMEQLGRAVIRYGWKHWSPGNGLKQN